MVIFEQSVETIEILVIGSVYSLNSQCSQLPQSSLISLIYSINIKSTVWN